MPGPEQPFDINNAIDGLNRTQLEGFIANAKAFLTQPDQPAASAQPDSAPAVNQRFTMPRRVFPPPPTERPRSGQGLGGAERAAPKKSFIEEIDDSLANAEEPIGKVFVTPQALALYLQKLRPKDASLQNINIEILDGRAVRAQGQIAKWGTSTFIVMLGSDQEGGELQVRSVDLPSVAGTHNTGEINQHLGNILSTLQKKFDGDIKDKTWHATGFSVSPDHKELVINFENGERKQAREDLQKTIVNFRDLMRNNKLDRPTLTQLAAIILERAKIEGVSPEQYANDLREQYLAAFIERGRIYPADPMVKGLFDLLHEGEAEAVKAIIGQKLDAAGDTPWASDWRSYLETPPAPLATARQSGEDSSNELLEGISQAGQDYDERKRQLAREGIRLLIEWDLQDITFSALTMADNIFRGKFLPDEEIWHKVKLLTPWEKKEELISSIAVKVSELAGKRDTLDAEDKAWLEAWEKELKPAPAAGLAPAAAGEPNGGGLESVAGADQHRDALAERRPAPELALVSSIQEVLLGQTGSSASVAVDKNHLVEYLKLLPMPENLEVFDADTFMFESSKVCRISLNLRTSIETPERHVYRALYFLNPSRPSTSRVIEDEIEGAASELGRQLEDYMRDLPGQIANNLVVQRQLPGNWQMTGIRVDENGQLYFDFQKREPEAKVEPLAAGLQPDAASAASDLPPAISGGGSEPAAAMAGPSTTEARPSPEQLEGAEVVIAELMKDGKTREEAIAYLEDLDRRNREKAES